MREFCVLVFLGLNSWLDIKKREISLVLAAMLAAFIWKIFRYTGIFRPVPEGIYT